MRLHGVDVALTICEDLWVEGGPCGVAGQAGVDLVVSPNASPYERAKDDLRLPLVRRRAAEAAGAGRLLQPGGRPGRAGLRRRLAGRLRRRRAAGPRAAVRRAPADRRPDLDPSSVPERRDGRIGPMTVTRHVRLRRAGARRSSRGPGTVAEPLSDCEEVWRALVLGLRGLHRQERHALGRAGPLRRHRLGAWSRRSPSTRSAPTACTASGCRRSGRASTRSPTPRTWRSGSGCTTRSCRSRRSSRRSTARWSCPASRRRTCRPACAARC